MLLINTYVAQSSIEGIGVFSAERVTSGQLIWALNPKFDVFIEERDLEGLPPHMRDYIARYTYPHLEMPGVVILDSDNGRFMNHSLTPNTDFRLFEKGYALTDIAEGEELTCNYYEIDPSFNGDFVGACLSPAVSARRSNGRRRNNGHRPGNGRRPAA
jgi:SET domain-containing protein